MTTELDIPLSSKKYDVTVEYCVPCDYSDHALEATRTLVRQYQHVINKLVLRMGHKGVFEVRVGDEVLFSKKAEQRFPQPQEMLERFKSLIGPRT